MTKLRLLATLALATALALPLTTSAQEDPVESVAPAAVAAEDTRIEDLRALVPEDFAGLPLRETLQFALGEELTESMDTEERGVFEAMLVAAGKDVRDYVAASAVVRLNDTDALIIQPHRVVGIDAQGTLEGWVEILGLNAQQPRVVQEDIDGRDVFLVSDDAQPEFPLLRLFAADDVVWMVVVGDEQVAAEAVRVLSETSEAAGSEE